MATGKIMTHARHVKQSGAANGWNYLLFDNKMIIGQGYSSFTKTHYTTVNNFFGYYSSWNTPFTMANEAYFVSITWKAGNGFGVFGGTLSRSTTQFTGYCLSTASGSIAIVTYQFICGFIK